MTLKASGDWRVADCPESYSALEFSSQQQHLGQQSLLVADQAKLLVLLIQQGTAVQTHPSRHIAHLKQLLASLDTVATDWIA